MRLHILKRLINYYIHRLTSNKLSLLVMHWFAIFPIISPLHPVDNPSIKKRKYKTIKVKTMRHSRSLLLIILNIGGFGYLENNWLYLDLLNAKYAFWYLHFYNNISYLQETSKDDDENPTDVDIESLSANMCINELSKSHTVGGTDENKKTATDDGTFVTVIEVNGLKNTEDKIPPKWVEKANLSSKFWYSLKVFIISKYIISEFQRNQILNSKRLFWNIPLVEAIL